ncbi:unnamed protein product, partial [Rotaria sp. Silwood2]
MENRQYEIFVSTSFRNIKASHTNFADARCMDANLSMSIFSHVNAKNAVFSNADFINTNITDSQLRSILSIRDARLPNGTLGHDPIQLPMHFVPMYRLFYLSIGSKIWPVDPKHSNFSPSPTLSCLGCDQSDAWDPKMGIKRKTEENVNEPEKKNKLDQIFPIETFVKNLKDPESSFLALSEFNEHVRHLSSQEEIDQLMENIRQDLKSNLNDVLALMTEEKRKSSENITLYRFLTTLLEYFSRKNDLTLSETIIKKFVSISSSIYTIYFMLSSHSTASHLKITLRFLLSMIQQNEYTARLIFPLIDFKRSCWKPLLKRRDIRDVEDVRYWVIKFFLSPLIYQHIDKIRNLIKEQ